MVVLPAPEGADTIINLGCLLPCIADFGFEISDYSRLKIQDSRFIIMIPRYRSKYVQHLLFDSFQGVFHHDDQFLDIAFIRF